MGNNWTIWLAERAVSFNAQKDLAKFGKSFSHPFLAMLDDDGEVKGEIHGTWPKKTPAYPVQYLMNKFTSAVRNDKVVDLCSKIAGPLFPHAIIVAVEQDRNFSKACEKQQLFQGAEQNVKALWQDVRSNFNQLNTQRPFLPVRLTG